jgi:hypothetical protein
MLGGEGSTEGEMVMTRMDEVRMNCRSLDVNDLDYD